MQLRIAERFGIDPRVVLFQFEHGLVRLCAGFEMLRGAEEARERENVLRMMAATAGVEVRE